MFGGLKASHITMSVAEGRRVRQARMVGASRITDIVALYMYAGMYVSRWICVRICVPLTAIGNYVQVYARVSTTMRIYIYVHRYRHSVYIYIYIYTHRVCMRLCVHIRLDF